MDVNRDSELMEKAILGKDAEEFINSEIGKYIVKRVDQERFEAVELLKEVSPWRKNRIRDLQNLIWRCDTFKGWLAEIIISGQQATQVLDQQQE